MRPDACRAGSLWRRRSAIRRHIARHGCRASCAGPGSRPKRAVRNDSSWYGQFAGAWLTVISAVIPGREANPESRDSGSGPADHPGMTDLYQILPGDDLTEPRVVRNEFLDEFMDAVLEDIVHMAVFKPVADAAGVALGGALAAIGDADLVEIAHEVAVATRERPRQRVVEDQEVGDQPRFQGLAVDPVISRQRRYRAQDRGPLVVVQRAADMFLLRQQHVILHVENARGVVGALQM